MRIVLVEPAGPLNVGSVARVMKNFGWGIGAAQLVLVNPQCDPADALALQMAVRARDVLAAAQVVDSLPAALGGTRRVAATLGRDSTFPAPLEAPRAIAPWLLAAPPLADPLPSHPVPPGCVDRLSEAVAPLAHPDGWAGESAAGEGGPGLVPSASALVFGREDSGLTNQELNYAQRLVRIPTDPGFPSLNLAQAVGLCCYELALARDGASLAEQEEASPAIAEESPPDGAEFGAIEDFYHDLATWLLEIGYVQASSLPARLAKFRRLLGRSHPSHNELALLRGILRQARWFASPAGSARRRPSP